MFRATSSLRAISSSLAHRHAEHPHSKPKPHPNSPKPKAEQQEYTRHTIHKVSSLLRTTTWSEARTHLTTTLATIKWDSHLVCKLLKTHPPLHKAWLFFTWVSTLPRFAHDRFTYTTMLDIFGEAGRVASMESLFKEMEEKGMVPDAVAYTAVMRWRAEAGDMDGARRAWREMRERELSPTVVSYTAYMKALFGCGRASEAAEVYAEMMAVGIRPSCHTYTVIMEHLAEAGKFQAVLDVMKGMIVAKVQLDKAACNILVEKCANAREIPTMLHVLQYMKENKLVLRHSVFLEALKAFEFAGESDRLLRDVNPHLALEAIKEMKLDAESSSPSYLIDRGIMFNLLARRDFAAIETMLRDMVSRDTVVDSDILFAIMEMSCWNSRPLVALMAFRYCIKMQKTLDKCACTMIIGLLIRLDLYIEIMEVVEEVIKSKITLETHLISILIQKFSSVGMLPFALKIFQCTHFDQNTTTYTAIINAFIQNGDAGKAEELFAEMSQRGIQVSLGTFEVLTTGLRKLGRIEEAEVYRKAKKKLQYDYDSGERVSADGAMCNLLYNI